MGNDRTVRAVFVIEMKPLAIELFAGTMSGTAGWCELGGRSIGFDLAYEAHHGTPHLNASRVIQDALTLDGAQFKAADFIWGSSPCQAYSYLAMPWSRSKCPLCKGTKLVFEWQLIVGVMKGASTELGKLVPCDCKENSAKAKELRRKWELDGPDNTLFDSVLRIQREASAAAGRFIPYIQENVRGAVPWIGKRDMSLSAWKSLTQAERIKAGRPDAVFGSFYLWGCCAQIGNRVVAGRELADIRAGRGRFDMGVAPKKALKGHGSTWFGIQNNGDTHDQRSVNPVSGANKVPGFRFDGSGRIFQTASVEASGVKQPGNNGERLWKDRPIPRFNNGENTHMGVKVPGQIQGKEYAMCRTGAAGQKTLGHVNKRDGHDHTRHLTNQAESDAVREGSKQGGMGRGDWFSKEARAEGASAKFSSRSNARKAASALIARIPPALSEYIAKVHFPPDVIT